MPSSTGSPSFQPSSYSVAPIASAAAAPCEASSAAAATSTAAASSPPSAPAPAPSACFPGPLLSVGDVRALASPPRPPCTLELSISTPVSTSSSSFRIRWISCCSGAAAQGVCVTPCQARWGSVADGGSRGAWTYLEVLLRAHDLVEELVVLLARRVEERRQPVRDALQAAVRVVVQGAVVVAAVHDLVVQPLVRGRLVHLVEGVALVPRALGLRDVALVGAVRDARVP